jgi:hypothetical protein
MQVAGHASTIALRFSGDAAIDGSPPSVTTHLFTGGGFGASYNSNRTLLIKPPTMPLPRLHANKVQLSFILSGHGECK